jgi:hypothetical protein
LNRRKVGALFEAFQLLFVFDVQFEIVLDAYERVEIQQFGERFFALGARETFEFV